jgi:hypothetical protein
MGAQYCVAARLRPWAGRHILRRISRSETCPLDLIGRWRTVRGMCGRFTQHYTWREIQELYGLVGAARNVEPRYNIAPTDRIDVVAVAAFCLSNVA